MCKGLRTTGGKQLAKIGFNKWYSIWNSKASIAYYFLKPVRGVFVCYLQNWSRISPASICYLESRQRRSTGELHMQSSKWGLLLQLSNLPNEYTPVVCLKEKKIINKKNQTTKKQQPKTNSPIFKILWGGMGGRMGESITKPSISMSM